MQRYFIPDNQFSESTIRILGDDAHHLIRVMRAEPGDEVLVSDGRGRTVRVRLTRLAKDEAEAEIVEELGENSEPKAEVWVAQSLPKGDKLETVIQKCTEIGAVRFIPFLSERTVVQYDGKKEAKRLERWRKIAKEAAEQAHRSRIPDVDAPLTWKQLLELIPSGGASLICYEKEDGLRLKTALDAAKIAGQEQTGGVPRFLVVVGPEGGFTEKEVAEAEAAGCRSVSLGKRILRTETAAMVALTCILYEIGEMGE